MGGSHTNYLYPARWGWINNKRNCLNDPALESSGWGGVGWVGAGAGSAFSRIFQFRGVHNLFNKNRGGGLVFCGGHPPYRSFWQLP